MAKAKELGGRGLFLKHLAVRGVGEAQKNYASFNRTNLVFSRTALAEAAT